MRNSWVLGFLLLAAGCGRLTRQSAVPVAGNPARGRAAIARHGCGSCHTIAGVSSAAGLVGPPLTGVANRMYIIFARHYPLAIVRLILDLSAIVSRPLITLSICEMETDPMLFVCERVKRLRRIGVRF
jgi:hypothetical protein